MGAPRRPFTTEYPLEVFFEMKALARIQDRNLGWIVRDAVKEYLSARQPIVVLEADRKLPKPKPKTSQQKPPARIEPGLGGHDEE